MRSKQEMLNIIVDVAKEDDRIRAVILTGSRANPNAPEDDYQDYDIFYFVGALEPFINNMEWIENHFGRPAIMQMPELMTLVPVHNEKRFTYLMLFEDGYRIDLSFQADYDIDEGEPAITLLDKDGLLPSMSASSDKCWHIKPPTRELFSDCCNEFWWCLGNVGKGIGRDELPYAMTMFNCYVRNMLDKMLEWHIGVDTGFSVSSGKHGKYFKRYLSGDLYEKYTRTYSSADYGQLWVATFTACDLFHAAALHVAGWFSYNYDQTEENAMISYLNWIQSRFA
jgi:aminoglycoside 6-adenylyltransferase